MDRKHRLHRQYRLHAPYDMDDRFLYLLISNPNLEAPSNLFSESSANTHMPPPTLCPFVWS